MMNLSISIWILSVGILYVLFVEASDLQTLEKHGLNPDELLSDNFLGVEINNGYNETVDSGTTSGHESDVDEDGKSLQENESKRRRHHHKKLKRTKFVRNDAMNSIKIEHQQENASGVNGRRRDNTESMNTGHGKKAIKRRKKLKRPKNISDEKWEELIEARRRLRIQRRVMRKRKRLQSASDENINHNFQSTTTSTESSLIIYDQKLEENQPIGDFSCINDDFIPAPVVFKAFIKYLRFENLQTGHAQLEAEYHCREGYEKAYRGRRDGNLVCHDGRWIGPRPECKRIRRRTLKDCSKIGLCDQICRFKKGQPVCLCFSGFERVDGKCVDINECTRNKSICEFGCSNTIGSYRCKCPTGLRRDGANNCIDINECNFRNGHGPCQDTCTNTYGSYNCACDKLPGTQLADDYHSCEDIDGCSIRNGGCSHTCLNTMMQSYCLCPDGWVLDEDWKTCVDVDECADQGSVPEEDRCKTGCVNTLGSFHCLQEELEADQPVVIEAIPICGPGLSFNRTTDDCEDVNECDINNGDCSDQCINTYGGHDCICRTGFIFGTDKKTCVPSIDVSDVACPPLFPPRQGYLECSRPAGQQITNRPGSQCILRCPVGYRMVGSYAKTCDNVGRWIGNGEGVCIRFPAPKLTCPADIKKEIPPEDTALELMIPPPKTDVDIDRDLSIDPESIRDKHEFEVGSYNVTYTVRHPVSKLRLSCTFLISIVDGRPPNVFFCPENQKHLISKLSDTIKLTWTEPVFIDNINVTQVVKSHSPGSYFGLGSHLITYEAIDAAGYTTQCRFKIIINGRRLYGHSFLPKF